MDSGKHVHSCLVDYLEGRRADLNAELKEASEFVWHSTAYGLEIRIRELDYIIQCIEGDFLDLVEVE